MRLLAGFLTSAALLAGLASWIGVSRQSASSEKPAPKSVPIIIASDKDQALTDQIADKTQEKVCTLIGAPVCGIDGTIYGNACLADGKTSYPIHPLAKFPKDGKCNPNDMSWITFEKPGSANN